MKEYQTIRDTSPLSLKVLNDQLRLLWYRVKNITEKDIRPDSINENHYKDNSISGEKIKEASIDTAHIKDAAIDNAKIKDASITNAKIANAEITEAKIAEAAIGTAHIKDLAVTKAKIANAAIDEAKIADAAIDTAHIKDLAVTKAKIANAAIDEAKIVDATIGTAKIQDAAITSAKIADAAIDTAKIQDAAITSAKIADAAIGTAKIQDAAITSAKIQQSQIENAHIKHGAIEQAHIAEGAVGSLQVAEGAIGDAHISRMSADKLDAGTVNTTKVTIASGDNRFVISGRKLQIFDRIDTQLYERIMLGIDESNNSALVLRGSDGQTALLTQDGLTEAGFTDGYNKLQDNSLDPKKLDIQKVVTRINDGTTLINWSKIQADERTLDVVFTQIENTIEDYGETISNHSSQISANAEAIQLKVDTQTFNQYKQTTDDNIDTITTNLSKATSDINVLQGQVALKVERTEVEQMIEDIEIDGRNLLHNTSDEWTELELSESDYFAQFVHPEVILEVGKTYVFSVIIEKVSDDDAPINIHLGTGTTSYEKDIHEWRLDNIPFGGKISLVYTIQEEDLGEHAGIFAWRIRNEQQATTVRFKEVKLEKGNKPTGWTPAPEDMVELIDNTAVRIEEQVAELAVSLDGITSEVSNVVTEINGLREHTETRIQQTSSELSMQITEDLSSLEENLIERFQTNIQITAEDLLLTFTGFQDSLDDLSGDIAKFQTTFRLSDEGLEIGRTEDLFKLFLTNNRMSFLDGSTEVAYVSDKRMFITEAEITNSFEVGNHLIEKYNDEITLVRWVGKGEEELWH